MDIKTAGGVEGPAGFEFDEATSGIPNAERGKLGMYNDAVVGALPAQLDMTKKGFTVNNRFEVIATLMPQSKPQLCTEGQRVQRTSELAGNAAGRVINRKFSFKSSDARYSADGGPDDPYVGNPPDDPALYEIVYCDYGDTRWCDDDYHGGGGADGAGVDGSDPPNGYKYYDAEKRILWLDAPGWSVLDKKSLAPNGAAYKAKFEAKVAGDLGSCYCSWEVIIEIDSTGRVTRNEVANKTCS
jgi:hypothetical protein